jgi:hypothetical protein
MSPHGVPNDNFNPGPFPLTSVDLLSPSDDDATSLNNNFIHSPTPIINEHSPVHHSPLPNVNCNSAHHPLVQDVGCQVSSSTPAPVTVYKEAKNCPYRYLTLQKCPGHPLP